MRPMEPRDWQAVCAILADWPYTEDDGHITPEKIDGYMRRWFQQFNPFVWEEAGRVVGMMNYRMNGIFLEITHAGVHPEDRDRGVFSRMASDLAIHLKSQGHEIAFFTVLEQAEFILNKFTRAGAGMGQTGRVFYGVADASFE